MSWVLATPGRTPGTGAWTPGACDRSRDGVRSHSRIENHTLKHRDWRPGLRDRNVLDVRSDAQVRGVSPSLTAIIKELSVISVLLTRRIFFRREDFFESLRPSCPCGDRLRGRLLCSPLFPPAEPGAKLSDAPSRVGQAATSSPPGFEGHRQYVTS